MDLMLFVGLIGLFLLAVGITLIARAVTMSGGRTSETLQQIGGYGFTPPRGDAVDQSPRRPLDDLASRAGNAISRRLGAGREQALRRKLIAAGMYRTTAARLLGYQALLAFASAFLWVWLASLGDADGLLFFAGLIAGTALGWYVPYFVVRSRASNRRNEIDHDLPELIDLLVVTIEAGVGFAGSLRIAAGRLHGPIAEELRLTLQEQNMGLSPNEALRNLQERADTPGTRMFVRAILQGETLGVSIGQIMRNLADEMRKRRRQAAEEKAQKAPIKILFPLLLLIFPAMFVVILLPAMIRILDTL